MAEKLTKARRTAGYKQVKIQSKKLSKLKSPKASKKVLEKLSPTT